MLAPLKVTILRQFDTHRLIPSRFADVEVSVLNPLAAGGAVLADLFELDNATNKRLRGESGTLPGIGVDELVFGVPNFRIINAAFTYTRLQGNRFNDGTRGAWYCAFDADSALAEIIFHRTAEYAEIGRFVDSVSYQTMLADFTGTFHDLRGAPSYAMCLERASYLYSQQLAERLLDAGSMGVIYPSVRHAGGTNLACFRPALVGHVRKGQAYRLTWSGSPTPQIEKI